MCHWILINLPVRQYVKPALAAAFVCFLGIADSLPYARPAEPPAFIPLDRVQWTVPVQHGASWRDSFKPNTGRWELSDLQHVMKRTGSVMRPVTVLRAGYSRDFAATDGSVRHAHLVFEYTLRGGESLPMLDAMYKVNDPAQSDLDLIRVSDKEFVKDLTDDKNLVVIPVGTPVQIDFHQEGEPLNDTSTVEVTQATGNGTADSPRRAHLSVWPGESILRDNFAKSGVTVGGIVPLVLNCQFTVKKIVPPDEKHKILGWVEFDPNPAAAQKKSDEK